MGKSEAQAGRTTNNQALVRGSVAYTDFMRRDTGKESLQSIATNTKQQVEYAKKQVTATENLGKSFEQCFDVIS